MTIASGADSRRPRNLSSAPRRSTLSTSASASAGAFRFFGALIGYFVSQIAPLRQEKKKFRRTRPSRACLDASTPHERHRETKRRSRSDAALHLDTTPVSLDDPS